jgi:hypothetical protein
MKRLALSTLPLLLICCSALAQNPSQQPIIPNLPAVPTRTVSTIPANGDINPYGVAFVPEGFPEDSELKPGDILVSNFNNSSNLQGTGATVVRITPHSAATIFFRGRSGLGLTTALGVLKRGFVLVGNVPTTDGTCSTVQQGSLLVLNRHGKEVASLTNAALLDGPWDLTIRDGGDVAQVFISNVLNGTVTRLTLKIPDKDGDVAADFAQSMVQIGSGYLHRCDPAALVVGPTGLALDPVQDLLYVASTGDNEIFSIANASTTPTRSGTGTLVYTDTVHLHGPLGLVLTPNGDLITSNGDAVNPDPNQPSEMVEFTPAGKFVAQRPVNSSGVGGAFGIVLESADDSNSLAAVDDIANAVDVWRIPR